MTKSLETKLWRNGINMAEARRKRFDVSRFLKPTRSDIKPRNWMDSNGLLDEAMRLGFCRGEGTGRRWEMMEEAQAFYQAYRRSLQRECLYRKRAKRNKQARQKRKSQKT